MQEKPVKSSQDENGVRMLNARSILAHNRHIQGGRAERSGCSVCKAGMGAMVNTVEVPTPEPSVVQDTGIDKSGDAASAHPDGWPYEPA